MGSLGKIFKGSSHKISKGQYQGKHADDVVWNEQLRSWDWLWQSEYEDTELYLSDEEPREENSSDNESHVEDDEDLARAIQESLNLQPPTHEYGHSYQPLPFFFPSNVRVCAGCNTEIGLGRSLSCMGAVWHLECVHCYSCDQPISDSELTMSGNYPYHKSCNTQRYAPICDVCKQFVPTNMNGHVVCKMHPFWLQKYCSSHELDGTSECCSCGRMEPRETNYVALDDGRKLCLDCQDSAIMDSDEGHPLYLEIHEFYEGLDMEVKQQIPLRLVERQALNEAIEGEESGHRYGPETRGLCLSEGYSGSNISRRREVTAILILYGLPRLITGTILAHEMMHARLCLQGFPILSPKVEEGICQVLAYMWLNSEIISESASTFERKLGDFYKHQIESDPSSVYGDGFRAGNRAIIRYGLQQTLDHIRMTGSFPD